MQQCINNRALRACFRRPLLRQCLDPDAAARPTAAEMAEGTVQWEEATRCGIHLGIAQRDALHLQWYLHSMNLCDVSHRTGPPGWAALEAVLKQNLPKEEAELGEEHDG